MKSDNQSDPDEDDLTLRDEPHSPTPDAPSQFDVDQAHRFEKTEILEPPNRRSNPPKQVSNFQLLNRVGQGGAGSVYRAKSIVDGSIVAVKILKPEIITSRVAVQRFEKEARLQAEIVSPYVTRLIEFGCENGRHFIVSEFVDGVSLRVLCKSLSQADKKYALIIIRDVLRALSAMHSAGVVHRDVKPENVLVTFEPHTNLEVPDFERFQIAKLTDFGLARHIEQSESMAMTHQKAILGTPIYLAPEQYSESRAVDARADVYSLGATLFHLLAGEPPFNAETFLELADLHRTERPRPLNSILESVGDALSNVVAKSLEKQPDLRYNDANAMLVDVENVMAGRAISIPIYPEVPAVTHNVRKFEFSFEFNATPATLWPLVSDTDRFNRAMGLPAPQYSFAEDEQNERNIWAQVNFNGLSVKWLENPFQWIEGRELTVLREFAAGPFIWVTSTVELFPLVNQRTRLVHSFQVEPRGLLGRLMTPIQFGWLTKKSLNKVYARIGELAKDSKDGLVCDLPFGKPVVLSKAQQTFLAEKIDTVRKSPAPPALVEKLERYLTTASDASVSRMRPRPLAHSLGFQPEEFLDLCLSATDVGLLSLMWDLICPVCRIASETTDSIRNIATHGHCEACNADFEVDFSKSVELIFRVHPEIRLTDTRTYCIGGPFHSPHVISQSRLKPRDRITIGTRLEQGSYQIRGPQLPASQPIGVKPTAISTRCSFNLLSVVPKPELLTGDVAIEVANPSDQILLTRIERMVDRDDATTAADVSRLPRFQQLFPGEVISADQLVNVTQAHLLLIRIFELESLIESVGEVGARAARNSLLNFLIEQSPEASVDGAGETIKIVSERLEPVLTSVLSCGKWLQDQTTETQVVSFGFAINRGEVLVGGSKEAEFFGKTIRVGQGLIQQTHPGELLMAAELAAADSIRDFTKQHLRTLATENSPTHSDGGQLRRFVVRSHP